MIAGILPLGLSERNSGVLCSSRMMSTRWGSYASPVSSSMIDTFTPLGVLSEYSWMRSGCRAGQRAVIGKADRSGTAVPRWGQPANVGAPAPECNAQAPRAAPGDAPAVGTSPTGTRYGRCCSAKAHARGAAERFRRGGCLQRRYGARLPAQAFPPDPARRHRHAAEGERPARPGMRLEHVDAE